jgi:hypothetical protein
MHSHTKWGVYGSQSTKFQEPKLHSKFIYLHVQKHVYLIVMN